MQYVKVCCHPVRWFSLPISGEILSQPQLPTHCGFCSGAGSSFLVWMTVVFRVLFYIIELWYTSWSGWDMFSQKPNKMWNTTHKVRNLRRGGVLFLAPPCSTWVFLTLGFSSVFGTMWGQQIIYQWFVCVPVNLRSQGTTKRSWWCPDGGASKSVYLANVFVMRMLYLKPRCKQKRSCQLNLYSCHQLELLKTEDILCSSKRYLLCHWAAADISLGLVVFCCYTVFSTHTKSKLSW